ncbi:oligosaccharide repeat unit polymerase [Modestobacter sp. DSM 44400]|uniref:O-antigen polymerase n=1 Tax=Modestobacter sp. DSM 44400 TaxID=1550230 RepID=UPI0008964766|nr:O-antigen polymerase [Modestobacter sp. DSM 44400]SDY75528.1 oligosaccharide repeat unit polymerase [Modestobacter sp. DSM 44400]
MIPLFVVLGVITLLVAGWPRGVTGGRWLTPGPFFTLYWALALLLPPLLAPGFYVSKPAVFFIVALVLCFVLGAYIAGGRRPAVRLPEHQPRQLNVRLLRQLVAFGAMSGFAATFVLQVVNGYSLTSVFSVSQLFQSATAISYERYSGNLVIPSSVPLLLSFTYAGALVAPFAAQGLRRRTALLCYASPVLGATAYAVVTTARAGMLTAFFFVLAGWIVQRIYWQGETPRLGWRAVVTGGAACVGVLGTFIAIAFMRVGTIDSQYVAVVLNKISVYAVGYLTGFSRYFDSQPPSFPHEWGAASLAGIAKNIGAGSEYGQALDDFVPLGNGGSTNIFTAWRYLVEDFGLIGTPIVAVAAGALLTLLWRRLVERPSPLVALGCLAGYAFLAHSVTLPIFTFTNVVLAFMVAAFMLTREAPAAAPVGACAWRRLVPPSRQRSSGTSDGSPVSGRGAHRPPEVGTATVVPVHGRQDSSGARSHHGVAAALPSVSALVEPRSPVSLADERVRRTHDWPRPSPQCR